MCGIINPFLMELVETLDLIQIHFVYFSISDCTVSILLDLLRARCSSVVRAFAHGAMGRRIDPSWGEPTELFLVPSSAPRLV